MNGYSDFLGQQFFTFYFLCNTVFSRKRKNKQKKTNSTHINSNSVTYINRRASITYKLTTIYKYIHVHNYTQNRNTNKHIHTQNSLPPF